MAKSSLQEVQFCKCIITDLENNCNTQNSFYTINQFFITMALFQLQPHD